MKDKTKKKIGWLFVIILVIGNSIVYNHAYRFTHFEEGNTGKTKRPEDLNFSEKLKTLFCGVSVAKPQNNEEPSRPFKTISLKSYEQLEAWEVRVPDEKGIVLLFHGYSSAKSGMLPYSAAFNELGYSTFLVDFMGSGGSSGNTTTVGYKESHDVKVAFEYVKEQNPATDIFLFGSSMGAVSIMKSIKDYNISPERIIIECPFGTMLTTTKKRFEAMGLPGTPFAEILLFYGGLQTGFNPFKHNPIAYAKSVTTPTLLLHGAKDLRVSREAIDNIYKNLQGEKEMTIFEKSGHEVYLNDHQEDWELVVTRFLEKE